MTKKRVELSIEENLLQQAKKSIPNLSRFVEECLKNYLGETSGTYPVADIQDLIDAIGKCQLRIQLLNERNKIEENIEKAKKDEILLAWRRIYAEYRDTRMLHEDHLTKASSTLNVTPEKLKEIIIMAFAFRDELDVTDWETVYKEYGDD